MSTSLPESLDCQSGITSQTSLRQPQKTIKSSDRVSSDPTVRARSSNVTPRSAPTPRIPESTGKFGTKVLPRESTSLPIFSVDQRLETITENPLSRQSTAVWSTRQDTPSKTLREVPTLTQRYSSIHKSPAGLSNSTVSAGDVHLSTSLSRSKASHLSASNATIFDDPSWLLENSKSPVESAFNFMKGLVGGLPRMKDKDPKWFLKIPPKTQDNRKDLEYINSKTSNYTGINSSWNPKKSESLKIIGKAKGHSKAKGKKDTISNRTGLSIHAVNKVPPVSS